ncbi:hypothetical protein J7E71_18795 [Mesobacillus foraminis]|uniref:hypothetical protein n=1 Tax=Mesobacillus foraminis TaxID=279826 RepID=UPI001BE5DF6B|nr:hypothetical protein [Mesobacillus foraminis]MBT2757925.1 hypothetical protein [Mesobacillus foraminis]
MKRTFELFEIEASMLPIFYTEEWKEYVDLREVPIDDEIVAYGFDNLSGKYLPLYSA